MWNMWPAAAGSGSGGIAPNNDMGFEDTDSLISMSLSMFEEDLFFGLGPLDHPSSMQKHFDFHADDEDDDEDEEEEVDELLLHSQLAEELLFGEDDMIDPVMQEVEAAIEAGDLNSLIDQFEQSEKTIQQLFTGSSNAGEQEEEDRSCGFSILQHEDVCMPAAASASASAKSAANANTAGMGSEKKRHASAAAAAAAASAPAAASSKASGASCSPAPASTSGRSLISASGRKAVDCNNNSISSSVKKNGGIVKKSKKNRSNGGISLLAKPAVCKKLHLSSPSPTKSKNPSVNNNGGVGGGIRCQNSYSRSSPVMKIMGGSEKKCISSSTQRFNNNSTTMTMTGSPIVIMERKLLHPNQNRLNAGTSIVLSSCVPVNHSISNNSSALCLRSRSSGAAAAATGTPTLILSTAKTIAKNSSSSSSCNTSSSGISSTNYSIISRSPSAAASQMIRSVNATAASDGTSSGSRSRFVQDHDYCPPAAVVAHSIDSAGASASFPIVLS